MKLSTLVILAALFTAASAQASTEYKMFYTTSDGKVISNEQALLAAMKGGAVYKCQSVEAKVNKYGSSISVRNVKRPSKKDTASSL